MCVFGEVIRKKARELVLGTLEGGRAGLSDAQLDEIVDGRVEMLVDDLIKVAPDEHTDAGKAKFPICSKCRKLCAPLLVPFGSEVLWRCPAGGCDMKEPVWVEVNVQKAFEEAAKAGPT